jgi:hypothetical protein
MLVPVEEDEKTEAYTESKNTEENNWIEKIK